MAVAALFGSADAGDLFGLTGGTTSGPFVKIEQGSNNLSRFVSDLMGGTGQFHDLNNRTFVARLRYGNVQNALRSTLPIPANGPRSSRPRSCNRV